MHDEPMDEATRTLDDLAARMRGELVRPGDAGYDQARLVWNGTADARPLAVARCAGVADVVAAVTHARANDLLVAVRGGAHSIPGFSTCDDGLVIDLTDLRAVRVDPVAKVAIAQGGCTWADFDHETQAFGLATTGGVVSTTGIGGFTTGGGIGWLTRLTGLTCDNLIGADVVTAEGVLVRADEETNPELLWALKGGGGNFGVVVSFEYRLVEVGPTILGGPTFYPGAEAESILKQCGRLLPAAPEHLTALISLNHAPPAPFLPEEVHGQPAVTVVVVWSGSDLDEGREAIRPFQELGTVWGTAVAETTYTAMQQAFDPVYPAGGFNYFRSAFIEDFGATTMKTLLTGHQQLPSPSSELVLHQLGGAMNRVPSEATAFATRDQDFILNVVARADTREGFDEVVPWARGVTDQLGDDVRGYVNFAGEASEDRVRASYPPQTYQRLVGVKDTFDPTNLFRLNQNIRPSGA